MKIFISWAGETSRQVALALRDWLPLIIQAIKPWMSEVDISAGSRWIKEISIELEQTSIGIICLTKENQHSPWLIFEAGALAKSISDAYVCPYLIDLEPSDIVQGPITQFQAKISNKSGTWDLIKMLNNALGENALDNAKLKLSFEKWWPDLEKKLDKIIKAKENEPGANLVRTDREVINEILALTRSLAIKIETFREQKSTEYKNSTKQVFPKSIDSKTLLETGLLDEFIEIHRR